MYLKDVYKRQVLEGNRDTALEADEFNFQMTITPADETSSMEGVVLPEGANNGTVTAANAANGLVSFGNIQFKAAGTYHVEISEVIPEKKDPNMTYDKQDVYKRQQTNSCTSKQARLD